VGTAIARNAWPARLGRDGTLHVAAADAIWAFELASRGEEIAARLAVPRIRFAPGPLPTVTASEPAPEVPHPGEEERRLAAEIVSGLGDGKLRESVQKAVSLGLARAAANRRF
jgi:hypothetical protein